MSRAASGLTSELEDPNYQPYGRRQSSVRPSRRPSTGGGDGDNQSDQPPYLPLSAKRKRPKPELLDPSPNPTTSRQRDGTRASLTHNDTGKTHENATSKEIGFSFVDPSLALIHHSIINKYGDIGRECPLVDPKLRTYVLESICKIVKELKGKTLETLDENSLATYYLSLRDAEFVKFDVKWLRQRLDELRDAVKSFTEAKQATNERIKLMEDIDDTKRNIQILKENIERIQLKVEEQERELAVKTNNAERSSYKISGVKAETFESPPKSIENDI